MVLGYLLGPRMQYESVDNSPLELRLELEEVEDHINSIESQYSDIRPDNESRVLWADSLRKTEYAVVYLHGFEASWAESDPILKNFQDRYGCNMIYGRISHQGRSGVDAMLEESPMGMVESAKKYLALGKLIGEKLIVFSCSTGSTYSTYLAAEDSGIHAQIMTSPNFDLHDSNSKFLTGPWGRQMLKFLVGDDYREWTAPESAKPYWNQRYRIEGLIALRDLLDQTMTPEIWRANKVPTYIAYYYRDEKNFDDIISIPAIKKFAETASIPQEKLKVDVIDDAQGHVISSKHMNTNWERVQDSIFSFAEKVLDMEPLPVVEPNIR